jgi:hypothetical protein
MSPNYKLVFWDVQAGNGDIGAPVRAQAAKAALALRKHPDVTFASSAGGYNDLEALEIALLVPVDYDPLTIQPVVESAMQNEGSTSKVSLKSDFRLYSHSGSQLAALKQATEIEDVETVRSQINHLVNLPKIEPAADNTLLTQQFINSLSAGCSADNASHLTPNLPVFAEEISISSRKYQIIANFDLAGPDVEGEVKALQDGIKELANAQSTNAAVHDMISSDIMTVGKDMWTAYSALQTAGDVTTMLSGLIASIGGVKKLIAALKPINETTNTICGIPNP